MLITMLTKKLAIQGSTLILAVFTACSSNSSADRSSILRDSTSIANGQLLFAQNCSPCHNFKTDGIGPQLGGLTKTIPIDWIEAFIKDPKAVIESKDERAQALLVKYKTVMPSFQQYTPNQFNELLAFMHTTEVPDPRKEFIDPNALKDPIIGSIPMSDIVVDLELLTQIPPSSQEQQLTRIAKFDFIPGTKKLFVMDLRGKLYYLNGNTPEVYMDMAELKPNFINKPGLATGFGSFAFHPEFANNGLLYTSHTESPGSGKADFDYADSIKVTLQWVLSEWKTKESGGFPFTGESREILRVNMVTPIHGMQEITFNPLAKKASDDYGLLYIGIGDGGSAESGYDFLCHSTEKIWGTVIRIDPKGTNGINGHYGIPDTNPFAKSKNLNTRREIFAYGFRNPHRITWSNAGDLFISNIGHHSVEGLYLIKPGSDSGWPIREGTFVIDPSQNMHNIYPLPADDAKFNFTYPVAQYDHDEGNAITGGFEYRGKALPQLFGKFVFGDIVKGRLFYVEMKDLKVGSQAPIKEWRISFNGSVKTLSELCGAQKVDERFGRDSNGELYITTKPDGKVYKLISANNVKPQ
jgi:glucose/arabinose dehydrogenase/mono/diheme cytochrome c family protein